MKPLHGIENPDGFAIASEFLNSVLPTRVNRQSNHQYHRLDCAYIQDKHTQGIRYLQSKLLYIVCDLDITLEKLINIF